MKYEKAKAEFVVFDNSDVLMVNSARCTYKSSKAEECINNGHESQQQMDPVWLENE